MRGLAGHARVLRDAAPLMFAELMPSLASLVDMVFAKGLGEHAVDGIGVGGYAVWLASVPLMGVYTGALVAVSQALGAGKRREAQLVLSESLGFALALSLAIALLVAASAPRLTGLLTAGPASAEAAARYLLYRLLGFPAAGAYMVLDAAHRAAGSNRAILHASAALALVNAALDAAAVGLLGAGVEGIGVATAAAEYTAAAVLAATLPRAGLRPSPRPPGRRGLLVARLGAPSTLERGLFSAGHGIYLSVLGRCGLKAQTAHVLGVRIESIAFLPVFALATYASSVVGNLVGAGRLGEAKQRGWEIAKASAVFMAAMGVMLAALAPLAAALLSPSRRVARLVTLYLLLAAATEPPLGLVMSLAGAIRGAGDTRTPTLINLSLLYTVRVAPSLLLPGAGLREEACAAVAWLLMDADVVARAAAFTIVYRRRFERLARRVV